MKHARVDAKMKGIDATDYLRKMISCNDSDACWCGSGIPFEKCHKSIENTPKSPKGRILNRINGLNKKRICLHPENLNCSGSIIDAHSIQNAKSLDSICESGLIYRFELDPNLLKDWKEYNTIIPKKIGKAKASTFKGFCSYHDQQLFMPIDTKLIEPTKEQSALLAIRSFAREIYAKNTVLEMKNISKEMQFGKDRQTQAIIQELSGLNIAGNELGLEDLMIHYANYFRILNKHEYQRMNRLIIKINEKPEVLCSGCFIPEIDAFGNELQDIGNDALLESLSFEVLYNGLEGIIHLCWYDDFISGRKFADSIIKNTDIPNTIVKIIFSLFENHAFKISWFDSLSVIKKKGIMHLAMCNTDPLELNQDSFIHDHKKYVNWTINTIIKEY